jgi:gliding motility-associated-like protein
MERWRSDYMSWSLVTLQATGGGSHDPPLTLTYTGAGSPVNPTTPGVGVPDASFSVCPLVTTTYTVTASDTYTGSPPAVATVTITVASCGCSISSLTADTTSCDPATNTYDLSGIITFAIPPTTGVLTVTDCSGNNQVFNPPFVSPLNYNINGISANGANCNVTAVFSDSLACTLTSNYISPSACIPLCVISSLTADTTSCNPPTNTYDLSGIITFSFPPTTGVLTVTDCNGNNQVFNPPFVSPLNYNINSISANGANCNVTAVFSDSLACTLTSNYISPIDCTPPACVFTSLQINDSTCVPKTNTYEINGSLTFANPPTTGNLTLTDCHGNNQVFNPPFTSPTNYNIGGINADGIPCNVTAIFSDDPACTIADNYQSPEVCVLDIIIPNVITPNDDDFNDFLHFKNLEFFENNIEILNRWGTTVFKKDNYQNDWDGDDLSDGTYFFILDVILPNSNNKVYKGTFTLIR